jgi:outer membrane biogenesis lipoprotein LolB
MTDSFIQCTHYCKNYFIQKLHLSSRYLLILVIFSQLLVTSCTINQSIDASADWTDLQIANYKIDKYRLKGSVSVELRNRSTMSSFELNKNNDLSTLVIRNFIGQEILTDDSGNILSILDKLNIKLSNKEFSSLEIDLFSILLADISKLDDYSIAVDKYGTPKRIIAHQLDIFFESYQSINNVVIPRKIRITSDDFQLTIVISVFDNMKISS